MGTEPETARSGNGQADNQLEPKAQPEPKAAEAAWERRWEQDKEHLLALAPTPEKTPIASYDAIPVLPKERERLLFAFDATASRSDAWEASKPLTDTLFEALPGQLDVALAVHSGGRVRCFTKYFTNAGAGKLRDQAARIRCEGGETRMLDLLDRVTWETPKAKTVLYIGDCFEECDRKARHIADKLKAQNTRIIILQEGHDPVASDVFESIAGRSGGCVLPFSLASIERVRELLGAVVVLTVAGPEGLKAARDTVPGALMLLAGIESAARLEGRKKK
jgi:hypothetical protein